MVKTMITETKKSGKNRSQKRAKRTRKKLKKAALDVFSEKSIDAATVEEITKKADVGKAGFCKELMHIPRAMTVIYESYAIKCCF